MQETQFTVQVSLCAPHSSQLNSFTLFKSQLWGPSGGLATHLQISQYKLQQFSYLGLEVGNPLGMGTDPNGPTAYSSW